MTALIDKYYTKVELASIATQKNVSEKYFQEFTNYIEDQIREMETNDGEFSEKDIKHVSQSLAVDYFTKLINQLRKGHSEKWARLYAENMEEPPRMATGINAQNI